MNSKRISAVARGSGIVTLLAFFATCTLSCGHTRSSAPTYGVSHALTQPRTGPAVADQTFEGIVHDGFELVPSGPGGKPDASQKSVLAFSVTQDTTTTKVTISAVNATNLKWALLTLKYDPGEMTPTKVDFGDFLSGEDVIDFSLLSRPGIVPVGICKENCDRVAGVSGSGTLATVTFSNTPFSGKSVSSAPRQGPTGTTWKYINKVNDLVQPVADQPGIQWSEKLDADGNLNGEVEISDLQAFVWNYGLDVKLPANQQCANVDYDGSGAIMVADIFPLAYFYYDTITGYDLYYAQVPAGDPPPTHSAMTRLTATMPDIPRPALTPSGPFGWYVYNYNLPYPVWLLADSMHDLYVQVVATGFQTDTSTEEESDPSTIGSQIVKVIRTRGGPGLVTKIYIQVNGVAAGETGTPGTATVAPSSQPTLTLYQVDDYNSFTGTTTTRDATAQEKAYTTWTSSNPAAVPMGTANMGDQTSPGVSPVYATSTVKADYYSSVPPVQVHITADCVVTVLGSRSVSGTALVGGVGLPGVTLTLTPGGQTATTQADGTYSITGVADATYTLMPTEATHWFTPASRSVVVSGADLTGQDFTAYPGGLVDSPWPKFHGNAQNTGLSQYTGAQTNHVKWTTAASSYVASSPAIGADGTVYIGSYDGKVYALRPADGGVMWSYTTGGIVTSSPAIGADGTVYVGSWDHNVYALNPADGSVKWAYATGGIVASSPAVGADGTVYIGSYNGKVYALNPSDGSVKWVHSTGGVVYSSPAIGLDGTVYAGSNDKNVSALDPANGSVKWTCTTGSSVESSPVIGADGTVYIGSSDSKVYALNPSDGSVKWAFPTGNPVSSSPAIGPDGTVYVGSADDNVYALNPSDGSVRWSHATGGIVMSSPAIGADGTVYVGSDDYDVYALNPSDGSVKWTYTTGGWVVSSPAIGADGTVYVGSDDDKVYAFGP